MNKLYTRKITKAKRSIAMLKKNLGEKISEKEVEKELANPINQNIIHTE